MCSGVSPSSVASSHGQLFSSNHFSTLSCPPYAAAIHKSLSKVTRPRRCKLFSVPKHPRSAACLGLSSLNEPFSPIASRITLAKSRKLAISSGE